MTQLIEAYREPQRQYHTRQHLQECLSLFSDCIEHAAEPGEVEIALWFHDAVYNIKASDNEERSAEWAADALCIANVSMERVTRVKAHVLATQHSALPNGPDQQLLVDIDLSILGAEPSRFEEYEQQIRQEYSHVPGFLFRRKRKQILAGFLERRSIYATPMLRERFEEQARRNIARSIAALGG